MWRLPLNQRHAEMWRTRFSRAVQSTSCDTSQCGGREDPSLQECREIPDGLSRQSLHVQAVNSVRHRNYQQGFAREVLSEIYATANLQPTTDDAGLAELAGIVVTTVEGSVESFKITTPFDLEMAQSFMNRK